MLTPFSLFSYFHVSTLPRYSSRLTTSINRLYRICSHRRAFWFTIISLYLYSRKWQNMCLKKIEKTATLGMCSFIFASTESQFQDTPDAFHCDGFFVVGLKPSSSLFNYRTVCNIFDIAERCRNSHRGCAPNNWQEYNWDSVMQNRMYIVLVCETTQKSAKSNILFFFNFKSIFH